MPILKIPRFCATIERMKALYRKYRPTKLEDVVGQEQVTNALSNALKQGKIGHAYLFSGPRGTGKTSVARIFAHAVNDFDYQLEDDYLDISEIDAASNNGVDNIRELREKAIIAPTKGKYKVYIIDEAHMLTKSAANALLKLLEEPPAHVIFIMATTEADKIPITILSRTQVHTFKLANPDAMLKHLRKISDAEDFKIDDGALKVVIKRGGGSFRDSLSLLDQVVTLTDQQITEELLNQALGLPQQQSINELLEAYANGDQTKVENLLKDLLNSGLKAETIASELISTIISNPRAELLPLLRKLADVSQPFPEAKLLVALLEDITTVQPIITQHTSIITSETKPVATGSTIAPASPVPQPQPATPEPEPVKPAPETPSQAKSDANQPFEWENFLEKVRGQSTSTYEQLKRCQYELKGDVLHVYPAQKFTAKILTDSEHSKIITNSLDGLGLVVEEKSSATNSNDPTIAQISAIMGEVQEVNEQMPF